MYRTSGHNERHTYTEANPLQGAAKWKEGPRWTDSMRRWKPGNGMLPEGPEGDLCYIVVCRVLMVREQIDTGE